MVNIKISASILNSDLSELGSEVRRVQAAGADILHIDVMDGIFVPPMTFGDVVLKSFRDKSTLTFDTHLMVREPERLIPSFVKAGSDIISVHVESGCNVKRAVEQIKSHGCKAGVVVNPPTPVESLFDLLGTADMFVLMSVNPGYGGQAYIPETNAKIIALKKEADKLGKEIVIEVDGGINEKTAPEAINAGADILVAGTYLFNSPDMKAAIARLKS